MLTVWWQSTDFQLIWLRNTQICSIKLLDLKMELNFLSIWDQMFLYVFYTFWILILFIIYVQTAISSSPLDKTSKVQLRSLSSKIHDWLSRWFSVGLLHLERMTWNSPTSMLQKVISTLINNLLNTLIGQF